MGNQFNVPREVLLTAVFFIVVLLFSTAVFHVYLGGKVIKVTGAHVQEVPKSPTNFDLGGSGGYWFNYLVDEEPEEENTTYGNLITGAVTGLGYGVDRSDEVSVAVIAEDNPSANLVGEYLFSPQFSFKIEQNVEEEYFNLRTEVLDFELAISQCKEQGAMTEACVDQVMAEFPGWDYNYACESTEESLFYDSVDIFQDCMLASDVNCLCAGQLQVTGGFPFAISLTIEDDEYTFFEMQGHDLSHALEVPVYGASLTTYGEVMKYPLERGYEIDDEELTDMIYLYLDFDGLSLLSEEDSAILEYSKDIPYCTQDKSVYTFCYNPNEVLSEIMIYDEGDPLADVDESIVDQPVYRFSMSFDDSIELTPETRPVYQEISASVVDYTGSYSSGSSGVYLRDVENVLVLGTSTTSHEGYVDYLNDELNDDGITFTRRGYSGCATYKIKDYLFQGIAAENCLETPSTILGFDIEDYDTLLVMLGLNDGLCSKDASATIGHLEEIYDYAKNTEGMNVIASTIHPSKHFYDSACSSGGDNSVEFTSELNDWIMSKPGNVDVAVDIHTSLSDGTGALKDEYKRTSTDIHPNQEGHKQIADDIIKQAFTITEDNVVSISDDVPLYNLEGIDNILVIGDSITAHGGQYYGYATYLDEKLPEVNVDSFGYSGSSSEYILNKLKTEINIDKYDMVMFLAGVNDGMCSANPYTNTVDNLVGFVNYIVDNGKIAVALTITPSKTWFDKQCSIEGTENSLIRTNTINSWLLERDIGIPDVYYAIDINTPLNDGNGYLKTEFMDGVNRDGLHPDEDAHAMMGQTIIDALSLPDEFEVDADNVQVVANKGCYMETMFPENSLSAIGACVGAGVEVIEVDVRETSDGHLVLMHDEGIERTTTSTADFKVSELTLNQIKSFDLLGLGEQKVPTLTEVMLIVKNSDVLISLNNVDSPSLFTKAISTLQATGTLDKAIFKSTNVQAFSDGILYMPIVDCRESLESCKNKLEFLKTDQPFAVEVWFSSGQVGELEPIFGELNLLGVKVWANSIEYGSMSGGYSDNIAKTGNLDGSYGELIDIGVTMIQTDHPFLLSSYLGDLNLAEGCIIFHGDTQDYEIHKEIAAQIESEECEYYYLFHVGDLVDLGGDSGQWENFVDAEEDLISKGIFYPVVGNHEVNSKAYDSEYGVTEIVNGVGGVAPYLGDMLGEYGYYVEDVTEDLVFIGLNNGIKYEMYYDGRSFTNFCTQQKDFLRQALEDSAGKDILVAYHAPAFPLLTRYSSDSCASNYWHPLIAEFVSKGNKAIVISGHNHGLSYAKKDGIFYLESGSGGGPFPKFECFLTAEGANVDEWGACERIHGYYRCDVGLTECIAKDETGKEWFTVDLS